MQHSEICMRKIFKIILVALAVIIIVPFASLSLIMGDVAGNLATDTHPLPNGAATGRALIVYDPGLSGGAKDVATKIGYDLQESGFDVLLAGVKSQAAANVSGYDVIVVGGPIYAGKPASTIQAYLNSLTPPANATVGVFGYGSIAINATDGEVIRDVTALSSGSPLTITAAAKITNSDDVDARCQEFVTSLLV